MVVVIALPNFVCGILTFLKNQFDWNPFGEIEFVV